MKNRRLGSNVATGVVNPFLVGAEQKVIHKFKPRIWGEFESSEDFLSVLEVLETAEEDDIVELSISSNGGCASALSTLLYAMDKCQAHVHVLYTGSNSSAGTFPLFHCDSFEMAEDATFMIHEAVCGIYPQTCSAGKAQADFTAEWNKRMLTRTYLGFFNEQELEEIMKGKQWYLFPEEVQERMDNRNEYLEKKQAEQEKKQRKAAQTAKRQQRNTLETI